MTENIKINKTSECQLRACRKYKNKDVEKHNIYNKNYYLNHKDDDEWVKNKRKATLIGVQKSRKKKREKQIELLGEIPKRGRPKKINFVDAN